MTTTFWFKPHGHWNIISEGVWLCLLKFYDPDMLKVTYDEQTTGT